MRIKTLREMIKSFLVDFFHIYIAVPVKYRTRVLVNCKEFVQFRDYSIFYKTTFMDFCYRNDLDWIKEVSESVALNAYKEDEKK